ncbi:hypothetical protein SUGI_0262600 [Cryptomeria japonica]|nr:hypothetical protein SUGI_0262600 [Cryptomeria japonica]
MKSFRTKLERKNLTRKLPHQVYCERRNTSTISDVVSLIIRFLLEVFQSMKNTNSRLVRGDQSLKRKQTVCINCPYCIMTLRCKSMLKSIFPPPPFYTLSTTRLHVRLSFSVWLELGSALVLFSFCAILIPDSGTEQSVKTLMAVRMNII